MGLEAAESDVIVQRLASRGRVLNINGGALLVLNLCLDNADGIMKRCFDVEEFPCRCP